MAEKENAKERVLTNFVTPANVWPLIEADLARGRVSTRVETAPKPKPKREPKPVKGIEGGGGYYWDNF